MCLLRREDRGGIYRLRMKGNINILLGFFLMALGLSSCSFSEDSYRDLSDIADKRLGIVKGTITDEQFVADYPQAPVKAYDKAMELFMDIEAGRLSMTIIEGLCECIDEVVDDAPEGPRVRIRFKLRIEK